MAKFLRTAILKKFWTAASETFSFYVSLNVFLHEQMTKKTTEELKKYNQSPEMLCKKKCS